MAADIAQKGGILFVLNGVSDAQSLLICLEGSPTSRTSDVEPYSKDKCNLAAIKWVALRQATQ